MKKFTDLILGLLISILIILTLVQFMAYTPGDYMKRFEALNIGPYNDLTHTELNQIAKDMSGFLLGIKPEFSSYLLVEGVEKDVFNEREKMHMEDVRLLFNWVKGITFAIFLGLSLVFRNVYRKNKSGFARLAGCSIVTTISLTGLLFLLQFVDFTKYFILFHELLFNNDLWLLDPNESLLINLLPEMYFQSFVVDVVMGTLIVNVAIYLILKIYDRGMRTFVKNN